MRWWVLLAAVLLVPVQLPAPGMSQSGDGDTQGEAMPLESGRQVFQHLDARLDPFDWYRINVTYGWILECYMITLNFSADVNFDVYIYRPDDREVVNATSRDQIETLSALVTMEGYYYILVKAESGARNYTLTANVYQPPEVRDGDIKEGFLRYHSHRDADWYRVYLKGGPEAQGVRVNMTHDDTGNLDLYLIDLWDGHSYYYNVSWWMGPPYEEVTGVASYTGYYYIKVHAYYLWGNYVLRVEVFDSHTDGDNTPENGTYIRYNSTWSGHVDQADDHYDFYVIDGKQDEELVIDLKITSGWKDLFSLLIFNSRHELLLEKTNFIFTPEYSIGDSIDVSYSLAYGRYYLAVTAKFGLKSNVSNLSDRTASGDYTFTVNMSRHPPEPPNMPPFLKKDAVITFDEDTQYTFDLDTYFADPEGKQLRYSVSSDHLKASVDAQGMCVLTPPENWYGEGSLTVTAYDDHDLSTTHTFRVKVTDVPEPPVITSCSPDEIEEIDEGGHQNFSVVVEDPDTAEPNITWYIDSTVLGYGPDVTYSPDFFSSGIHVVRAEVTDGTSTVSRSWIFRVRNVNRPPEIIDITPQNGAAFYEDQEVHLTAVLRDPDRDSVAWRVREGMDVLAEGSGSTADCSFHLKPGEHKITFEAYDGEDTSRRIIHLNIRERNYHGLLLALTAALVCVLAVYRRATAVLSGRASGVRHRDSERGK